MIATALGVVLSGLLSASAGDRIGDADPPSTPGVSRRCELGGSAVAEMLARGDDVEYRVVDSAGKVFWRRRVLDTPGDLTCFFVDDAQDRRFYSEFTGRALRQDVFCFPADSQEHMFDCFRLDGKRRIGRAAGWLVP